MLHQTATFIINIMHSLKPEKSIELLNYVCESKRKTCFVISSRDEIVHGAVVKPLKAFLLELIIWKISRSSPRDLDKSISRSGINCFDLLKTDGGERVLSRFLVSLRMKFVLACRNPVSCI